MECGRTNHLRLMGAEQHVLFAEAQAETQIESSWFAFVVRSMQIDCTPAEEVRSGDDVLVKAQVRVAFISEGRVHPIPKSLRLLMKADLV